MYLDYYTISSDTIAAIATPPGEGGIAIIRLSGNRAISIANQLFSKTINHLPSHTMHFGKFLNHSRRVIDTGLLCIMHSPNSYTGEDIVELHCHGNTLIAETILMRAIELGARLANPGEFTFRAFKNGKMDLTQAESVQNLISAKSARALQTAQMQLQGHLSKHIDSFKQGILKIAAHIEAWIDYPEENLDPLTLQSIQFTITNIQSKLQDLIDRFNDGDKLFTGYWICLIGSPNVGKSSLMNTLLKKDRVIVTDIPGTTRDLIEEEFMLGSLYCKLIDTAGLRDTEDTIEKAGIVKTKEVLSNADLILFILDASRDLSQEEKAILSELPMSSTLIIWNKIDLVDPSITSPDMPKDIIPISAIQGLHIDTLQIAMQKKLEKNLPAKDEIVITKKRHMHALQKVIYALHQVETSLNANQSPELIASDLRESLEHLNTFSGGNVSEEILESIFSTFCVGK
ncbi:MAG: tRNA uridine-5-carboxymethylaminomethyl(34) synthesis GTPase MnmE [Chlamydiales bacterium]